MGIPCNKQSLWDRKEDAMSSITNENLEQDGSITFSGSTGSKEFAICTTFERNEQWKARSTVTINVSADSAEDAKAWIQENSEEIERAIPLCYEADYEMDTWDPELDGMMVDGEITREGGQLHVALEDEG